MPLDSQLVEGNPRRILLACPQRIGDVLLATPLARTLKRAWPEAELDMLVFEGCEGVLAENPDIAGVIVVPRRAGFFAKLAELQRLWRRYDLALTPLPTDRARVYCWAAGRRRIGLASPGIKDRPKTLLLNRHLDFDDLDTHTVAMGLRLVELLGIQPYFEVVAPGIAPGSQEGLRAQLGPLADHPFAVLHPHPRFAYKMWPAASWVALARWLHRRGLGVVFTGGNEPAELDYVDSIAASFPGETLTRNLAGTLTLGATAEIIRWSRLYVGPDTAVTHIAAATGTPTVALFGPSNPVKWGPWPHQWKSLTSPWRRRGGGRQGNVFLVQGPGDCVPCMLEGCQRNVRSGSDCLQQLAAATVIDAAEMLLSERAAVA